MKPEELRIACALLGWNYTDLAKKLRVSRSTVSHWANGRGKIPGLAAFAIEGILKSHGFNPKIDIETLKANSAKENGN